MKTGIYAILNFVTNKIYIGSAVRLQYRWKNHRTGLYTNKHSNRYLQSAYNKYGQFSFIYYVLEECEIKNLIKREQYWIDFYKAADREFGYNLSPTAGNCIGVKHTDEVKAILSAKRKGKPRTPEAKAAIKAGWEKRRANGPVSEETKRKQSESHKGQLKPQEFKDAVRQRMIGNTFNNGRIQSKETVENRTNKLIGRKRTPEQIANIMEGKRLAAKRREKDLLWT